MSCATIKVTAKTNIDADSFIPSGQLIQELEETTDTTATLAQVKGNLETANLVFLRTTPKSMHVYLKIGQQTDGPSQPSPTTNQSPVSVNNFFNQDTQTGADPTQANPWTSTITYADYSPIFSTNTVIPCGPGTTQRGWIMNDQTVVVELKRTRTAIVRYS